MVVVLIKNVPKPNDPLLHEDLGVVIAEFLEQRVHLLAREAVVLQRAREEEHEVLDAEHEAGLRAVGRVRLQRRHDARRRLRPQLVEVAARHEPVARVEDVVLAHEEPDDAVEVGPVALGGLVHVGGRLQGQAGLLPPLLPVVLLEGLALAQHRVDVEAPVHGTEVDQVLGREVLLRVVRRLRLALIVHL